jgi:hypothetical protein
MQHLASIAVSFGMNEVRLLMLAICLIGLTACANSGPNERAREPSASEIAQLIGCNTEEVALCIESHCQLEEWRCVPRSDVKYMFKVDEIDR